MAGLPTKSDVSALDRDSSRAMRQLHQIFESRGGERSAHAHTHWRQVLRLGFPHEKLEDWRYTSVSSLLSNQFFAPQQQVLATEWVESLALPFDCHRLVFVDGRLVADLSDSDTGVFEFEKMSPATQQMLPDSVQSEVFLHLTESLAQDLLYLRLPEGKQAEKPLYLLHLISGRDQPCEMNTVHHRCHLVIESGAKAEVIEHYLSLNNHGHFTGARVTVNVGDNADFTHYKLAFENQASFHFSHNDLVIGRDARVSSHSFLMGAGLIRNNTSVQLNGEDSDLNVNSLVLPVDSEIADTRTYLEHNKGYCSSNQLHKTIVSNCAKAIFNGMVKVAQHALKTEGKMTNNNLLLGKHSEVDTKPQLEIYADDVKCGHGATVGRIEDKQLFYLRTRGMSEQDAKQMIIFAFAAELTEAIENKTLREVVTARIAGRLNRGK